MEADAPTPPSSASSFVPKGPRLRRLPTADFSVQTGRTDLQQSLNLSLGAVGGEEEAALLSSSGFFSSPIDSAQSPGAASLAASGQPAAAAVFETAPANLFSSKYYDLRATAPAVYAEKEQDVLEQTDLVVELSTVNPKLWKELITPEVVGGKAIHLAEMMFAAHKAELSGIKHRVPIIVPSAGCVTIHAYNAHIAALGIEKALRELLKSADDPDLEHRLSNIRKIIVGGQNDPELVEVVQALLDRMPPHVKSLAVRSSSTMEDTGDKSYAGQYDTYLNVPRHSIKEVMRAIKMCWGSMWTTLLISYRSNAGVSSELLPSMAVVLQHQLNPRSSGVLFTLNPNGHQYESVVESVFGLGEGVVAGEISPNNFIANWREHTIVSRTTPKQTKKFAFRTEQQAASGNSNEAAASGGDYVCITETSAEEQTKPSLSDEEVLDLVELGKTVASFYKHPQDIEWAIEDGRIYLLQSRAITAFSVSASGSWSYAGFADSCMMTLSLSAVSYARMMMGVLQAEAGGKSIKEEDLTRYFFGRAYIDSELWSTYGTKIAEVRAVRSFEQTTQAVLAKLDAHKKAYHEMAPRRARLEAECRKMELGELKKEFFDFLEFQHYSDMTSFVVGEAVEYFEHEVNSYLKWLNKAHKGDFSIAKLVDGVNCDSEAKRSSQILTQIANVVVRNPGVALLMKQKSVHVLASRSYYRKLRSDPVFTGVFSLFDQYCERFFYLSSRSDEDVGCTRLKQDPIIAWSILINLCKSIEKPMRVDVPALRKMLSSPLGGITSVETEASRAEKARVEEEIPKHAKKDAAEAHLAKFGGALAGLRLFLHRKEEVHVAYSQSQYFLRLSISELMRRFDLVGGQWVGDEKSGTISTEHPVWCLTCDEVESFVRDDLSREERLARLNTAETVWNMFQNMKPPSYISGRSRKVKVEDRSGAGAAGAAQSGKYFSGVGCSAGEVVGPARVIKSLSEAHLLKKGDVLVTRYTDPSWTPLFSLAVAVVLEEGGILSHAAVVSRECNIPAVVQVRDITKKVRDGQRVRVDGSEGSISVVEEGKE